jgi:hypothetical protein
MEPLDDLWSFAGFLFARWRWSEDDNGIGRYVAWLLIPLILLLVWRFYSRRRVGREVAVPRPAALVVRPGQDSEFYLIEQHLQTAGLGRHTTEAPSQWIDRIRATDLAPILSLHNRYRFDPQGLSPQERSALRTQADAWLSTHHTAESHGAGGGAAG